MSAKATNASALAGPAEPVPHRRCVGFCIASLALATLGCSSSDQTGTFVASAAFGVFGEDGTLTETDVITKTPGVDYGWKLELHSTSGKAKVTEVFRLPAPAQWGTRLPVQQPGLRLLSSRISEGGRAQTEEFLVTSHETVTLLERYGIAASDPIGRYLITISIDSRPFAEFAFDVVEPQ